MDNCEFSWISLITKVFRNVCLPLSLSLRDNPILSMHIYFLKGDLGSFKKGVSSIITEYFVCMYYMCLKVYSHQLLPTGILMLLTTTKMPKFQVYIL